MANINNELINDIAEALMQCLTADYFGNLTIKVNIQGGKIRNANFQPERSKKYE